MASMSSSVVPASSMARTTTGTMLVRCAREAISGTTPPNTRCTSCDRITKDFCFTWSPFPSRIAAEVSSHDVSMPRMRVTLLRAFGEKSVHQRARLRRIPVRRRHELLPDDTILADDERLRIAADVIEIGDLSLRIVQHLEGQ